MCGAVDGRNKMHDSGALWFQNKNAAASHVMCGTFDLRWGCDVRFRKRKSIRAAVARSRILAGFTLNLNHSTPNAKFYYKLALTPSADIFSFTSSREWSLGSFIGARARARSLADHKMSNTNRKRVLCLVVLISSAVRFSFQFSHIKYT